MDDEPRTFIKCNLTANERGSVCVALPDYRAMNTDGLFATAEPDGRLTAWVGVPDAILTNGRLDEAKLRARYRGNARWDKAGVVDGVQA